MSDLLTETQAAKRLLLGERTLRQERKRGNIRYVLLGARKIAYRPEDCDEYVAARVRVEVPRPTGDSGTPRRKGRGSPPTGNVVPFSQRAGR